MDKSVAVGDKQGSKRAGDAGSRDGHGEVLPGLRFSSSEDMLSPENA